MYARLLMCAVREGNIEYNYGPQTFLHISYTTIQSGIRNTIKHKIGDYERQQDARTKGDSTHLPSSHRNIEMGKKRPTFCSDGSKEPLNINAMFVPSCLPSINLCIFW